MVSFEFFYFASLSVKKPWPVLRRNQETAQTVIWLCEWIILSRGQFEGSTELQENSWWKHYSPWSMTISKIRLILSKPQWVFFNAWFGNSFISESRFWKILLLISCYTLQTAQTAKWPCGRIFSSIGYFGGATEVQLSRKGNTARHRSINSSAMQLKFRAQAIFFQSLILKVIILKNCLWAFSCYTWY